MAEHDPDKPHDASAGRGQQREDGASLIDRRTLIKGGLIAGGALAGGRAAIAAVAKLADPDGKTDLARAAAGMRPVQQSRSASAGSSKARVPAKRHAPNILVIMVDQLRTPQWFTAGMAAATAMPNLTRLTSSGVPFARHYTASNDCSPARAALLTGLYTHQTGCMITGGSTLDPGFPTWGTMLREQGYRTYWYGKWHLTHGDNHWDAYEDAGALEPYGFAGGTYPSPDGAPGQGWRTDPHILGQFENWLANAPKNAPWCTTVSFVNPHDIAWWYRVSDRFAVEAQASRVITRMPPNFETPEEMSVRGKPALQRSLQDTADASFGPVPYTGPGVSAAWLPFLDLYMKLQSEVDTHIGAVLNALAERSAIAANTVVVFTSDHGEYGASHGMRGKGAAVYEEAIRVPLVVLDPRRTLTRAPGRARTGLTSSVDVPGLLLDIATGSSEWRKQSEYSHIASRHDLGRMLRDPSAPGREHVLHATDEIVTEFAVEPYAAEAPLHVAAIRTPKAKYATYSNFVPAGMKALSNGREAELYDYTTSAGRMELSNLAGKSPLEEQLGARLERAVTEELREPLPSRLYAAHKRGVADYLKTAQRAALRATEIRRQRLEAEIETERPQFEGEAESFDESFRRRAPRRAGRAGSKRRTRL